MSEDPSFPDDEAARLFFLDCLEADYRSGNKTALVAALSLCGRHQLETPAWARTEKAALDWATWNFRTFADDLSASGSKAWADDPLNVLRYAESKSKAFDVMFEAANRGDRLATAGVLAIAGAMLKTGQSLPEPLLDFVFGHLRGKIKAKRRKPGPHKFNLLMRDVIIARVVEDIAETMGFSPTRNDATEQVSAASIVREALKVGANLHLTESAINQIYGRFNGHTARNKR